METKKPHDTTPSPIRRYSVRYAHALASRDQAYCERNTLACVVAMYIAMNGGRAGAWLDAAGEAGFQTVVGFELPGGEQVSFHMDERDPRRPWDALPKYPNSDVGNPWDGHDDHVKWSRVLEFLKRREAPLAAPTDQDVTPPLTFPVVPAPRQVVTPESVLRLHELLDDFYSERIDAKSFAGSWRTLRPRVQASLDDLGGAVKGLGPAALDGCPCCRRRGTLTLSAFDEGKFLAVCSACGRLSDPRLRLQSPFNL